jgi:hypothetical protein
MPGLTVCMFLGSMYLHFASLFVLLYLLTFHVHILNFPKLRSVGKSANSRSFEGIFEFSQYNTTLINYGSLDPSAWPTPTLIAVISWRYEPSNLMPEMRSRLRKIDTTLTIKISTRQPSSLPPSHPLYYHSSTMPLDPQHS